MFTFLNSAVLLGLTAVAIPILIHLFTRKKIKTVAFSSLRFLKELQKRQIRRLKLRQLLLLILRVLLILLLVLAFSRPALRKTKGASLEARAQLTAVIILDNTLSMGKEVAGRQIWETARETALQVVDLMKPGDEIYLLYPQDPPIIPHSGPRLSLDSMREFIENTELSHGGTDYAAALGLAQSIMNESSNINKEIYLIGDLQKNGLGLGNGTTERDIFTDDVNLYVLPISSPNVENLSVTSVKFANQILEKGKVIEVVATIQNNSEESISNKLVHLFVNGKRVGQTSVALAGAAATDVVFRIVPDRAGLQSGYVLLEEDGLIADNRRYFTFHIPDKIRVLLVGNSNEDTYFLTLALDPDREGDSHAELTRTTAEGLPSQNLDNLQIVVLSNVASLDHSQTLRIQEFVARGGGLLAFLGDNVNLRNYNENLHKKMNLPLLTQSITSRGQDQFLSLGNYDFSHPVFRDVFEGEQNVISPHFRFAINVKSDKPIDKIIEFSNGSPFFFESRYQKGRILYFTSGVTNDWSDLALRGIFVLLINRSVTYLAGATAEEKDEIFANQPITYTPARDLTNPDLSMENPDGRQIGIKPEVSQGNYHVQFTETDRPGIYRLSNQDKTLTHWAVNYDPAEVEPETFSPDELGQFVDEQRLFVLDTGEKMSEKVVESRFGRELWKYFAAGALLLLLIEMVVFRERGNLSKKE